MPTPVHVTDADFETTIQGADSPVLIDFWAPWWGPCRVIAPVLEELAHTYAGQLTVVKAKVYEVPVWAKSYHVRGLPTMVFIKNGQEVDRQVGMITRRNLEEKVQQFLRE